ncbi:MAG TPA: recombinase family protein, partial [Bacilli bacterium]|nr:recombinase family protein [Bacilli bacterium]
MTKRAVKLVRKKRVLSRKKNVAAYARVSTSKDTMLHSLSAQVSYYSDLIQRTPGWLYVGVYVDEGITGTKALRPNFTRLINDARAGKIDLIITKSISRFARNTVVLLETVRELKSMNVEVFFEEQNLYSLSEEGELILSFLASYAQEEARSVSENLKWSIRNGFKKGKAWNTYVFGYEFKDGTFYVNKPEADIVKEIYRQYLNGKGTPAIAKYLNEKGIRTKLNNEWRHGGVAYVLRNYLYTGNMLLQSTFKDSFITKRKTKNNGE